MICIFQKVFLIPLTVLMAWNDAQSFYVCKRRSFQKFDERTFEWSKLFHKALFAVDFDVENSSYLITRWRLVQNATISIVISLDIYCKWHLTIKSLVLLDPKHLLEYWNFLSSFSKIVWFHLTVTPSIGLETKHRIDFSYALWHERMR